MSAITFERKEDKLILKYEPEMDPTWLIRKLKKERSATISRTFTVDEDNYIGDLDYVKSSETEVYEFTIGSVTDDYYIIDQEVLGISYPLSISTSVTLKLSHFKAHRDISIFSRIDDLAVESLTIGGDHEDAIPIEVYNELVRRFPNSTEVTKYARARVFSILKNHLQTNKDSEADYNKYLNKKESFKGSNPVKILAEYETQKYDDLYQKLSDMLVNCDSYNEKQWQSEILHIILLLNPRYINAIREGMIKDSWEKTTRSVDFLLLDTNGFIDAVEIKQPMEKALITDHQRCRGNHVPVRELSTTVMQLEKYLYHFNRWGEAGEKELQKKYEKEGKIPQGFKIKIVNPQGVIIMGRDEAFTESQTNDFEVIRRQYRHVMDIITYDDLLRRLQVIRDHFSAQMVKSPTMPI